MKLRISIILFLFFANGFCIDNISLKIGTNINFYNNDYQQVSFLSPIQLFLNQNLTSHTNLKYGIGYISRAVKFQLNNTIIDSNLNITNNGINKYEFNNYYLLLSIRPEYFINLNNFIIYFNVGPNLDIYLNSYQYNFGDIKFNRNSNVVDAIYSITEGLGFILKYNKFTFGIENEYFENLIPVFRNEPNSYFFLNIIFNLVVTYYF